MIGFAFSFYCFEAATTEENPLEFLLKSLNRAVGDVAYDENGKSKIGNYFTLRKREGGGGMVRAYRPHPKFFASHFSCKKSTV